MTDLEGTKPYYIAIDIPKEHTDAVDAIIEKLKAQLESEKKIKAAEVVRRQRPED